MGFDSATSSFLALLVNKSVKKTEKGKIKRKVFNFAIQKILSRNFFQETHLRDLKSLVGQ